MPRTSWRFRHSGALQHVSSISTSDGSHRARTAVHLTAGQTPRPIITSGRPLHSGCNAHKEACRFALLSSQLHRSNGSHPLARASQYLKHSSPPLSKVCRDLLRNCSSAPPPPPPNRQAPSLVLHSPFPVQCRQQTASRAHHTEYPGISYLLQAHTSIGTSPFVFERCTRMYLGCLTSTHSSSNCNSCLPYPSVLVLA